MFESIQLALSDYRRAGIRRALNHFRKSALTLLASRLGRMALQAAHELDGIELTSDERRHLATARLLTSIHNSGIEAEDWIVKALAELALREMELPRPVSALESFYP